MKKAKCDVVKSALIGLPFEEITLCNTHQRSDIHNRDYIPKDCELHKKKYHKDV